jgi:hypothetical protein
MSEELETLKTDVKKLNAKATQAKMDLHDLSEELPTNWQQIMSVAQRAFDAHQALTEARAKLAAVQA